MTFFFLSETPAGRIEAVFFGKDAKSRWEKFLKGVGR